MGSIPILQFQHIGKRTKYTVDEHITVMGYTDTKNQRRKTGFWVDASSFWAAMGQNSKKDYINWANKFQPSQNQLKLKH